MEITVHVARGFVWCEVEKARGETNLFLKKTGDDSAANKSCMNNNFDE